MNLRAAQAHARRFLTSHGVDDAALEAEILLRHTLGFNRARLFTEFERELSPGEAGIYQSLLLRRVSGEPTAYITAHREFYGLDFYVDKNVLIPRPETELLLEKTIEIAREYKSPAIADIGTGSGALAVCLAFNLPGARIHAVDISPKALAVAAKNAQKHGVAGRINFIESDLLKALPGYVDIIAANLPYVNTADCAGTPEPLTALDGGADGTDIIRRLCVQAKDKLRAGGALLLEIGAGQDNILKEFLTDIFPAAQISIYNDLGGINRVLVVKI